MKDIPFCANPLRYATPNTVTDEASEIPRISSFSPHAIHTPQLYAVHCNRVFDIPLDI